MAKLLGVYDRSAEEQAKGYEAHVFRAGNVLQSAEMNEVQAYAAYRVKQLGDALYKDGDIVRDARAIVEQATGATTLESGAVYLRGSVRGVPATKLTIPVTGTIVIGIYLNEKTITEADDPSLLDPAKETRSYQEPGAARLQVIPQWGYQDDGSSTGEFFPIYYVDNGQLRAKEAPPQLDSVSQAIARYDRDSTGSSYIVSGMQVTMLADDELHNQVYSIKDGRARINGFGLSLNTSRRLLYPAVPDLRFIDSEPHASTQATAQRVELNRTPISDISQVRITEQKTVSLVHGTFSGAQDPLPDTSIIEISLVKQGATTFVKGTDYVLTAGKVDWSPSGAEPAPGSTYEVTYQNITSAVPANVDDTGFTVVGAVPGTLILVNYSCKLPRIDRLCMDESGQFLWIQGVATDYNPVRPQVPSNVLAICQVMQNWNSTRRVVSDGVRMVSMPEIEGITSRLDILTDLLAQQKLISDASTRESAAKKGMFVDPFLNDDQRDQGIPQTAATLGYALTLPIDGDAYSVSDDVSGAVCCNFELTSILEQTSRTGMMNINPYMAFAVEPTPVTLSPAVDRWTETQTNWLSAITQKFIIDNRSHDWNKNIAGFPSYTDSTTSNVLQGSTSSRIENLRQIEVQFQVSGWGPGEKLTSFKFDGIEISPVAN